MNGRTGPTVPGHVVGGDGGNGQAEDGRDATSRSWTHRLLPGGRRALPWHAGAFAAGVVVPALALWSGTPWPALALPLLVAAAVYGGVREHRRIRADLEQARAQVRRESVHDELTGCSNDAGLRIFGSHLLEGARRSGDALHAFVVDISGLGRVNDMVGRESGDEVLVAVAEAVRASVRGTDVLARGYGDEFVVVGPGSGVHPGELQRRVRAFLIESPPVALDVWPCRVSVGQAALQPWDSGDLDDLVTRAYQDLQLRVALRAPSAPEPPMATSP